ncbi:MAG: hypothetical protein K8T25_10575 [Planctomycetia bacterium]|nr:hypothetical protein [Planctomycetia bacterium]
MPKPNHLLDHLLNPKNRDRLSALLVTADSDRLQVEYFVNRGDWHTVANYIDGPTRWPVTWFPDANVAFLDTTTPVWDALRLAALGTPNGSTIISGVAEAEMTEWLNDPYRNKDRAAAIKAAMDGETWCGKFRVGPSHPLNAALHSYTHLLGFRRSLARPCPDGTTLVNTIAMNKSDTMNEIRNKLGPRAQGLAKKGRDDAEANGAINISDEMHCMMAILYALQNRRDTVILTADADYIEIFYKAQWFFDAHYRAWLAAKLIKAGQYGEPVKEMQDTKGYFDGPLTLYRRPTAHMMEVLPHDSRAVRVGVLYVAPDGRLHKLSFPFELKMLEMLVSRAATGRCTDLFGDANIHIDLGPLKCTMDGLYLGIGKDSMIRFEANGIGSLLGRLDLEHSVCCFERFSR